MNYVRSGVLKFVNTSLGSIHYLYNAMGSKLRKQTKINNTPETTTDYIGSFVYEDNGTFELRYILTPEGRVMANPDGTFEYQYFLKDHLGNTRVTFTETGEIIQENSYYPFGMAMNGLNYETGLDYKNKYLYNGKELQDEFGLDWYDYGARFYDAQLGRWHSVDPLAHEFPWQSPFMVFDGNPINKIDPTGMFADWFQNKLTGDVYYNSEMRKGDESKLGENWAHMGENNMFSDGSPMTSDASILMKNQGLTSGGATTTNHYDKSPIFTDAKITGINIEATFKGRNAETFMNKQGYDKKPFEANVYSYHSQKGVADVHSTIWLTTDYEITEKVHSWRYIQQGVKGSYDILDYYKRGYSNSNPWTNTYTRKTWERRQYDYSKPPAVKVGAFGQLLLEIFKNVPNLK